MKCVSCRSGSMREGTTTLTIERGSMILVVRQVPALVCTQCGEEYVTDAIQTELERIADQAEREGATVVIRTFGQQAPVGL